MTLRAAKITVAIALTALTLGAAADPAAAGTPIWKLEQPAPPAGAPFKVPLGAPGDLEFFAPNRGLLAVEGNATVARGLYAYNGVAWHPLSTVCGGPGDTTRIAFAGADEFWTVSEPSKPRVGSGTALCHFKNGVVIGSYSTAEQSPDPIRQMDSAACNGPADCWFGGFGSQDPSGERVGAFHLHWDGATLETVYAPQGRGVTAIAASGAGFYESTVVGRRPEDPSTSIDLAAPEAQPALIHRISGTVFANDPFTFAPLPGVPADGTELLALDGDASQLWAVGGGAASGPSAPPGSVVARPPVAARLSGGSWQQVALDGSAFAAGERFSDVAPVPATTDAWVTVQPFADRNATNVKAKVAKVSANGSVQLVRLPASGAGRGSAAKVACTSATDCWLVTYAGWLFHYTDGSQLAADTDPAYAGVITARPNEAAEQSVPDAPPIDDSLLFAPPPVAVEQAAAQGKVKKLSPLLRRIKSRLRGNTLSIAFNLTRKARVSLIARGKKSRIVARTKPRLLGPGRHTLSLELDRDNWPKRLSLRTREPGQGGGGNGDSGDTVTT